MKKREPVSHIMTSHVYSVKDDDTLMNVVDIFRKHKIRHLPVIKGKSIVGIISSTDIDRLTFGALFEREDTTDQALLEMLTIPHVMTSKLITVSPDTSIKEVAEIFTSAHFHALPVVEGEKLKGIVTTTDVIKYMLEQY
jgi:CBS domain-containing protein